MTLRFVVAPDGDRTVLGWSLDDAALRARVRSMLRDAPVTGTITGRPDLKRLERPGTGGGYFTLRPWVDLALGVASQESSSDSELALVTRAVASMPNRGATPILTFADGTAGPTPSLVLEVLVQEGTIEDLRALGQFAMGQGMREALEGLGGTEAGSTMGGPIGVQPPVVTPSPAPTAPSPGTRPPAP